jgi:hypothetical protein
MSGFKIQTAAKPILQRASRDAIENYFGRVAKAERAAAWIRDDNRYRISCTVKFEADVKRLREPPPPRRTLSADKHRHARAYVGASSPTHIIDGWSFLGRAVDATLRGDTYSSAHFAYYAELRAAMGLLGSEGLGVFNGIHAVIEDRATSYFPVRGKARTHELVWPLLKFWSTLPRSGQLLDLIIRPNQFQLSTWLAELNCPVPLRALGQKWMELWGVDLASTKNDHDARNLASYRPSEFRKAPGYGAANIANYVTDLWRLFEPGENRRFHSAERHLLKAAWEAGGSPVIAPAQLGPLGFGVAEASNLGSVAQFVGDLCVSTGIHKVFDGCPGVLGAPIRRGGASPLRVATGGPASWRLEARCRRSPAPANRTARLGFRVGESTSSAGCDWGEKDDLWLWPG